MSDCLTPNAANNQIPSQTWCVLPFTHINFKAYGYVGACWRNQSNLGNYQTENLQEIWNGPAFQELRRQLIDGEKPRACRSCWDMEAAGIVSTRQQSNKDQAELIAGIADPRSPVQPLNVASIEVRVHNECNLMCRHCGPQNSSRWETLAAKNTEVKNLLEASDIGYDSRTPVIKLSPLGLRNVREDFLPHVKHIMISGGEPLLQEEHLLMLKDLAPHAEGKTLEYNTNLHTLSHRNESFVPFWKKYKKVILRVSLDGDPSMYEYFRVHGNLKLIEKNLVTLQKAYRGDEDRLFLQATCTTSIYQITRLHRIAAYINRLGVYFHTSLVQFPVAINVQKLPLSLRRRAAADIREFLDTMENDDSLWTHDFWQKAEHRARQVRRLRQYLEKCLGYLEVSRKMDDALDMDTRRWIETLDLSQDTSFIDVYPEFREHWLQSSPNPPSTTA